MKNQSHYLTNEDPLVGIEGKTRVALCGTPVPNATCSGEIDSKDFQPGSKFPINTLLDCRKCWEKGFKRYIYPIHTRKGAEDYTE